MEIKREGLMFILSSPSGAGKTTLARHLISVSKKLVMSVSVTTRLKRKDEQEGVDYYFINQDKYYQMLKNDELLEHAKVFNHFYGTPRQYVEEFLNSGIDVLFDIDWQGAHQLKKKLPERVVSIFILPPSMQKLEERLKNRAQDSAEIVAGRMQGASKEIGHWIDYDYIIINDNIKQSMAKIVHILEAERLKRFRQINLQDFVNQLIT